MTHVLISSYYILDNRNRNNCDYSIDKRGSVLYYKLPISITILYMYQLLSVYHSCCKLYVMTSMFYLICKSTPTLMLQLTSVYLKKRFKNCICYNIFTNSCDIFHFYWHAHSFLYITVIL